MYFPSKAHQSGEQYLISYNNVPGAKKNERESRKPSQNRMKKPKGSIKRKAQQHCFTLMHAKLIYDMETIKTCTNREEII